MRRVQRFRRGLAALMPLRCQRKLQCAVTHCGVQNGKAVFPTAAKWPHPACAHLPLSCAGGAGSCRSRASLPMAH